MDALRAALEEAKNRQKRKVEIAAVTGKKYVRRGDIEKGVAKAPKQVDTLTTAQEEVIVPLDMAPEEVKKFIPVSEVKARLRTYGQPATLFGETDEMRLQRLGQTELNAHEKHHGSKGFSNSFQEIIQQEVEHELVEALASMESDPAKDKQKEMKKKRHDKYSRHRPRDEFKRVEDYTMYFFKRVLHEWECELDERPQELKQSTKGKVASATHKQTRQYMRPLYLLMKKRETPKDILECVEGIVHACEARDYVKATESYMKMAIGNAPWPMGVTMVGIHERAGRAKIHSHNIAHVLNDEVQRKYVQAIKRLISFHQHKYPGLASKNVG